MNLNRKTSLKYSCAGMVVLGTALFIYPFFASLSPAYNAIEKYQIEIDASVQKPGELKEYSGYGEPIWVYRRTSEQINWLKSYSPTEVFDFVLENTDTESFNGTYRSQDPEYFVFTAMKWGDRVYLQQEKHWYPCGTIKMLDGKTEVVDDKALNSAIACLENHIAYDLDNFAHVYDIAGMPRKQYVAPLKVPYHEIKYNGKIVVGPRPL